MTKDLSPEDLRNLDLIDKYDDPLSGYATLKWSDYSLLYIVVLIFVVFIVWANIATVDELARGIGRVAPSKDVQLVQNLEGGIISEIFVQEGDEVNAGQPLLRLSDVQFSGEYQANLERLMTLRAAITRLQAEAAGLDSVEFDDTLVKNAPEIIEIERQVFKANKEQRASERAVLTQQLQQREQEIVEINEQIKGLQKIYDLSREELEMITPLAERGTVSRVELIQTEGQVAAQEAELNNLKASFARVKAGAEEAQNRLAELGTRITADAQQQIAERAAELTNLEKIISAFEDRDKRTEITSPVDGIVRDILITTVGGVVQPGETIMDIVPTNDNLIVEANISPTDIAFISPMQEASIKLTAYDYTIYGDLPAKVVGISADSFENERGEIFYRVRLQSNQPSLTYRGETLEVIPGMVANVDILTGKKTVMSYLLKPFKKTLGNSLRER